MIIYVDLFINIHFIFTVFVIPGSLVVVITSPVLSVNEGMRFVAADVKLLISCCGCAVTTSQVTVHTGAVDSELFTQFVGFSLVVLQIKSKSVKEVTSSNRSM